MLATCAIDKTVALWDTQHAGSSPDSKPIPCGNKDMNVGKLYSVAFYQSSPWLVGSGGSGNQLALWNLESEEVFRNRFGDRLDASMQPKKGEEKAYDFEAMMTATDQAALEAKDKAEDKKKKGKGKSKKKAPKKK